MDTKGRLASRFSTTAALSVAACMLSFTMTRTAPATDGIRGPDQVGVTIHTTSPAAEELGAWAVKRYRSAGLTLPEIDLYFHTNESGCRGYVAYQIDGRIDFCGRLAMEPGPQRIVLHELAHAWCDANMDEASRARFIDQRGLVSWNGSSTDYKARGYEQAAEIIAWGLGVGSPTPVIEGQTDPSGLTVSFRLLTDLEPANSSR